LKFGEIFREENYLEENGTATSGKHVEVDFGTYLQLSI
jgi:hypothetical protein